MTSGWAPCSSFLSGDGQNHNVQVLNGLQSEAPDWMFAPSPVPPAIKAKMNVGGVDGHAKCVNFTNVVGTATWNSNGWIEPGDPTNGWSGMYCTTPDFPFEKPLW